MIKRDNVKFAALGCLGIAGMFLLGLMHPYAFREDGYVEGSTAVLFAISMTLAILQIVTAKRAGASVARVWLLAALAGFAALLCLSEISFGARMFNLQMPQMRGGGEFDGGHDFVIVVYRYATGEGRMPEAIALATLAIAGVATLLWRFRTELLRFVRYVLADRFAFRLLWILSLLALAVGLDLLPWRKATLLEEAVEFCASVMYAFMLLEPEPAATAAIPGSDHLLH